MHLKTKPFDSPSQQPSHGVWSPLFLSKQQDRFLSPPPPNVDIVNVSVDVWVMNAASARAVCDSKDIKSSQSYTTSSNLTFANCLSADNVKCFSTCLVCGLDSLSLQRPTLHFTACTHLMEPSAVQCSTTAALSVAFQDSPDDISRCTEATIRNVESFEGSTLLFPIHCSFYWQSLIFQPRGYFLSCVFHIQM